jgi:ABC-type uncharacterized transport system substrate-binding protein
LSEGKPDRARVEVLVTHGVVGTKAAQSVTKTIPIVFAVAPDARGSRRPR